MPNWASTWGKRGEVAAKKVISEQNDTQIPIILGNPQVLSPCLQWFVKSDRWSNLLFGPELDRVLSFWAQASKNSTWWVSKESRKWPWSAWSGPCAAETDQPPAGNLSRSGWRIMGKPRFCRLKHEWIAHIANTIHRFRNLSRNQVIMFDINSLWVFAGQRSGAKPFSKCGSKVHLQNWAHLSTCRIAMVRFWKHKRNPIKSEWSSWVLLNIFSGSKLKKFAPDLWHGLIAARSLEFPALPNFQPPLKQHMQHLSIITC